MKLNQILEDLNFGKFKNAIRMKEGKGPIINGIERTLVTTFPYHIEVKGPSPTKDAEFKKIGQHVYISITPEEAKETQGLKLKDIK